MSNYDSQNNLELLEEYARREARAYAMFEKQYQRRYPMPTRPRAVKRLPGLAWVFLLIAVAGSLLAAERTVSVFTEIAKLTANNQLIAYSVGAIAFIVVDVGAIMFRYARVFLTYRYAETPPSITVWVSRGAAFALGTQLAAQLYGVRGIVSWLPGGVEDAMQLVIALAAALSGMILAFVTGEILAVMALQAQHENRSERVQYDADMVIWREGLTSSWNAARPRLVGSQPRAAKRPAMHPDIASDRRADRQRRKLTKLSPTAEKALQVLVSQSDPSALTVRQLSELSGVNRDAANKAIQWYEMSLSERVSASSNGHRNGHSHEEG